MKRTMLAIPVLVACGDGGGFPDAAVDAPPPTATFSLSWSVLDQNNQPIACSRIAGQTMTVLTFNRAYDGGSTQIFTCDGAMGQSQTIVSGTYDFEFELAGTFGLLARGADQTGVDVAPGANTELSPVTFQVEAFGGLALQLSANQPGGNCGAANAGGAGIDAMTITLERTGDGMCVPVTFAISAGASQGAGTYTVDCTTPVEVPCIESDQVLTVSDVPSDGYTIGVRGKVAAKTCWFNNDAIQVPPLRKALTRTLNLARDTSVGGC